MTEAIICLDTGVWIKFLVAEEPAEVRDAATHLVMRSLTSGRLVAPAFAWTEVGSVLRKKVRQSLLQMEQAEQLWDLFGRLPIQYVDTPALRGRAWDLAEQYGLPTLYDAAFLSCTEVSHAPEEAAREFWTTDEVLLRSLGATPPPYVHRLHAQPN